MRERILQFVAIALAAGACRSESSTGKADKVETIDVDVPWSTLSSHAANGDSAAHIYSALWNLLAARRLALRVQPDDTSLDHAVKELVLVACGGSQIDPRRKAIIDRASIDDLYPPDKVEAAGSASCGVLLLRNDQKVRGAVVDWW